MADLGCPSLVPGWGVSRLLQLGPRPGRVWAAPAWFHAGADWGCFSLVPGWGGSRLLQPGSRLGWIGAAPAWFQAGADLDCSSLILGWGGFIGSSRSSKTSSSSSCSGIISSCSCMSRCNNNRQFHSGSRCVLRVARCSLFLLHTSLFQRIWKNNTAAAEAQQAEEAAAQKQRLW